MDLSLISSTEINIDKYFGQTLRKVYNFFISVRRKVTRNYEIMDVEKILYFNNIVHEEHIHSSLVCQNQMVSGFYRIFFSIFQVQFIIIATSVIRNFYDKLMLYFLSEPNRSFYTGKASNFQPLWIQSTSALV